MTAAAAATVDHLLGGRVRLDQPRQGFRAAVDPVLLAAAVPAEAGATVLDLGCGSGAAALCLAVRVAGVTVVGLEREPATAALAAANAAANGLSGRVGIVAGDLCDLPAALRERQFDHVMLNPPFGLAGRERPPADPARAAAMVEAGADLAEWLAVAAARTRSGGTVTVIHRADRLADVLAGLGRRAGGLAVLPLWPRPGVAAKRVVVSGRIASRAPLRLLPGLVLHADDGRFTVAADAVLRDGGAIGLWPARGGAIALEPAGRVDVVGPGSEILACPPNRE